MDRSTIIKKLRPCIKNLLDEGENSYGLPAQFKELNKDNSVVAKYNFDTTSNKPEILLRNDWQDVDVAHELMHMKIELIDCYHVLALKEGIESSESIFKAGDCLKTYVDDEIIFSRLIEMGLILDGEVLRSQLFDNFYNRVTSNLKKLKARPDDGMAHLDKYGYGELRRSAFLIQAENIKNNYSDLLPHDRLKRVDRFIGEFRTQRSKEAEKADMMLTFFKDYDVMSISGHKEILWNWAQMENLTAYFGLSIYKREGEKYILPWP